MISHQLLHNPKYLQTFNQPLCDPRAPLPLYLEDNLNLVSIVYNPVITYNLPLKLAYKYT